MTASVTSAATITPALAGTAAACITAADITAADITAADITAAVDITAAAIARTVAQARYGFSVLTTLNVGMPSVPCTTCQTSVGAVTTSPWSSQSIGPDVPTRLMLPPASSALTPA
jgi:hypothetical protein